MARLVNKQFNSPIKLYSPQNVQEILDRETQLLANGAIGIDFHQLAKPANLKNSAVLRMLEEEENRKQNGKGVKQVVWPPPSDFEEYTLIEEAPVYAQGGPQYQNQQPSTVQQQQQQQPQSRNKPSPLSPQNFQKAQQHQQQQQQKPQSPQQYISSSPQPKGWAPVLSPQQCHTAPPPAITRQIVVAAPPPPQPPPATITLRPEAPISQKPAPVYFSQPATAQLKGGINMRGDQKWPPETVKVQMQAENEHRRLIAKGPACRPRLQRKDYTQFFAQHALNSTYPRYQAPPGTQYYAEDQQGVTNF